MERKRYLLASLAEAIAGHVDVLGSLQTYDVTWEKIARLVTGHWLVLTANGSVCHRDVAHLVTEQLLDSLEQSGALEPCSVYADDALAVIVELELAVEAVSKSMCRSLESVFRVDQPERPTKAKLDMCSEDSVGVFIITQQDEF